MPDGSSDTTAIDFYTSSFCKEFLDAADPMRFAKEQITYGSDIYAGFRGHVWPANTLEEIAHGGRLVGGGRIPLARLDEGSPAVGSTDAGQGITANRHGRGLAASPIRKTAANRHESGPSRKAHAASDVTDPARWLREPDTFKVLRDSGLLYRVLREFGWDASRVGDAVEWATPRLRRLRPASSATCSDDRMLAARKRPRQPLLTSLLFWRAC